MDELELLFEDEAKVYLPKVVADENERRANELERIANEEKRVSNEKERVENEEKRKITMEQFDAMKEELIATVEKTSFLKEFKLMYETTTEHENTFKLPDEYTETSMLSVYVNGMKLYVNEYIVDLVNNTVMLVKPLDVIGTVVELVAFRLTTANTEDYETLKGEGVPVGGTAGQVLVKKSDSDYETEWVDASLSSDTEPDWVDIPITHSKFTPTTNGYGSGCSGIQYRKIGNHVYFRAGLQVEASTIVTNGETIVAKVPEEIIPNMAKENLRASICFSFMGSGRAMGRGQITGYNGRNELVIDYLYDIINRNYVSTATWIGFYFDYFID